MKYLKIILSYEIKGKVLALGAQSKSSFCLAEGNSMYLSDSGGDLGDLGNFKFFEKQIKILQKKLRIKPSIIACDMHPEYISTKYANELVKGEGLRVNGIQHHEAHVASCIVDNNIKGKVIGVAFDGTGFGLDGNIWGGEFFVGDLKGLKRIAHLKYIPMPSAEACIREPWRMALSYLYSIYGRAMKNLKIDFVSKMNKEKMDFLIQMIDKRINSPLTSSIGRLFDAISALIGVCSYTKYEGEPAIELEQKIQKVVGKWWMVDGYNFNITEEREKGFIIDADLVIKGTVRDLRNRVPNAIISLKFHNTVCAIIKDVCILLRKKYNINKVCLSGGVFQNKYLRENTKLILEKEGFKAYLHNRVPANDGGIALGQAVLAR